MLKNIEEDDGLYKLKEVLKLYPMLTTYSVNKAVNENKLSCILLGKTRYYKKRDIEAFLNSNKKSAYKYTKF